LKPGLNRRLYGVASIYPDRAVVVGRCESWTITYKVGERGLDVGGGLVIVLPLGGFSGIRHFPDVSMDGKWDVWEITEPGYVWVTASNPKTRLVVEGGSQRYTPPARDYGWSTLREGRPMFLWPGRPLYIRVEGHPLKEGDEIRVLWGDTSSGSPGVVTGTLAREAEILVAVDPDGELRGPLCGYYPLESPPKIRILPERAVKLVVTVPSKVSMGERFEVTVVARDKYENVASGYRGVLEVKCSDPSAHLPEIVRMESKDRGVLRFTASLRSVGVHRITLTDEENGLKGVSNPIDCSEAKPDYRIYWGDPHVHTSLSDGLGTLEECYIYARDVADLDFAAVTDHDSMLTDEEWELTKKAAARFYEPGRFVTFSGYEYSERRHGGDKCVYYLTDDQPIFRYIDEGSRTPSELWEKLKGRKALTVPHHPTHKRMRTNWDIHDPHFQRLVEIYSEWGNSEYPSNPRPVCLNHLHEEREPPEGTTVQEALARGYRLGIIAGSDNHSGQPGYCDQMGNFSRRRAYHGGLTAIYAKELTREALWDSLWNRRCYATTGARIILEFSVDGHIMGEEFSTERAPKIKVRVLGTANIQKTEVIRSNKVIFVKRGDGSELQFEFLDGEIGPGLNYYYVRVTQEDGEMAWSSPVWVEMTLGKR